MFFIMNNRKLFLILTIVASIFIGFFCTRLKMDSSITSVLPNNDPDIIYNNNISREFGNNEEIYVVLTSNSSLWTPQNLTIIEKTTEFLKAQKGIQVEGISSITTILSQYEVNQSTPSEQSTQLEDTEIKAERTKVNYLYTQEEVDIANKKITNNPLAYGQIINKEGTITIVRAPIVLGFSSDDKALSALINNTRETITKYIEGSDITAEFTGVPVINSDISKYMIMDIYYLFPITIIIVMFTIIIMLRSVKGALIPLIITLLSVLWTFGLKGLFGAPLTLTEAVIPVVLISIACADGIHVTQQALYFINKGVPGQAAAMDAIKFVRVPVILSAVTTAQGFGSLVLSPGVSMKNMGIFLAIGVIVAMIFTLYLAPIMISYFGTTKNVKFMSRFEEKSLSSKDPNNKVKKLGNFLLDKKWLMLFFTIIIILFCIPGIINTKTDLDEVRYFKETTPVRVATEKIEQQMGGITNMYVIFEKKDGTPILNSSFIQKIDKIQTKATDFEEVSFTTSYASFVKYLNYVLKKQSDGSYSLPENRIMLQRLISTLKNTNQIPKQELNKYLTADNKKANLNIRLHDTNTTVLKTVADKLEPQLQKEGFYKYDAKNIPNDAIIYRFAGDYIKIKNGSIIVKSQINSLIGALIAIFILLTIIYKSPLVSFIVTIPVMIAVFFNFTLMWILGISLNPATSIIASVGIGAGVDFAIHYFSRFKRIFLLTRDYRKSLIDALIESHRSILSNAASVATGFLVLLFSQYTIIQNFGWIVSLTMITSAIGALIILPALLYIFKPKIRK